MYVWYNAEILQSHFLVFANASNCQLYMVADLLPDKGGPAELQKDATADVHLDGTSDETELSDAPEQYDTSETSQEYEVSKEITADEPILVRIA